MKFLSFVFIVSSLSCGKDDNYNPPLKIIKSSSIKQECSSSFCYYPLFSETFTCKEISCPDEDGYMPGRVCQSCPECTYYMRCPRSNRQGDSCLVEGKLIRCMHCPLPEFEDCLLQNRIIIN